MARTALLATDPDRCCYGHSGLRFRENDAVRWQLMRRVRPIVQAKTIQIRAGIQEMVGKSSDSGEKK